jgi:prepilin-type N-terminal cleavage/methylation domain-containing protein
MRSPSGFSLVEMSVVLVIVAVLIGGIIPAVTAQLEMKGINTAKHEISDIKEALLGFVVANRRFPCPATVNSGGAESFNPVPSIPSDGGNCTSKHGFVPAVSLGLRGNVNSDTLLLDPWGNPYRYSISDTNTDSTSTTCPPVTVPNPWPNTWDLTTKGKMAVVGANCPNRNLSVCRNSDNPCTIKLTNDGGNGVPAIVYSMGKNWAETLQHNSPNELENVGASVTSGSLTYLIANNSDFVSAPYRSDKTVNHFDDIVDWISPTLLYNRMVMAGIYP